MRRISGNTGFIKGLFRVIAMGVACAACGLIPRSIDITYQPTSMARQMPPAHSATVGIVTLDGRTTNTDRVSVKGDADSGLELADITVSHDLRETVSDAFAREIRLRGIHVDGGGTTVQITVRRFYNQFHSAGSFSWRSSMASVVLQVKILANGGRATFEKFYEGTGIVPRIQGFQVTDAAQQALNEAFSDCVHQVFLDEEFLQGIGAV